MLSDHLKRMNIEIYKTHERFLDNFMKGVSFVCCGCTQITTYVQKYLIIPGASTTYVTLQHGNVKKTVFVKKRVFVGKENMFVP